MIVARAFPGPGSGRRGRLALDPRASASTARTSPGSRPATPARPRRRAATTRRSPGSPASRRARGSATTASSTCPTPIGNMAQHARDRRRVRGGRADGMDVINFSGGGPRPSPRTTPDRDGPERRRGRRRAGDLGRERPRRVRLRLGRLAGHGAGRDLGRGGLEHAGLRRRRSRSRRPARARLRAGRPACRRPRLGHEPTAPSSTSARSSAATGGRSTAALRRRPAIRTRDASTLPRGLARGRDRARLARRLHVRLQGAARAGGRRASGSCSSTTAPARRTAIPVQLRSRPA